MHLEVLKKEQKELLPKIAIFGNQFYLVGGTAIALQLGHRYSIDFDLFCFKSFNQNTIIKKLVQQEIEHTILFKNFEGIHFISGGVKLTFFEYPFNIPSKIPLHEKLLMPSLLDLAAMKAYALGRRSKWKDYVDLYFILKEQFSLIEVTERASQIFQGGFSKKLFKAQLGFFQDIDYLEEVEYLPGFKISDTKIKNFLKKTSLELY